MFDMCALILHSRLPSGLNLPLVFREGKVLGEIDGLKPGMEVATLRTRRRSIPGR